MHVAEAYTFERALLVDENSDLATVATVRKNSDLATVVTTVREQIVDTDRVRLVLRPHGGTVGEGRTR
ncbi:hypothetical protein [Rhodococcus globerulus]|uniref:hypothetical protein n=1 Tax=Rhodococcus globerulus TaxID=33008 RepID=UPI002164F2D1|nr:hypothetical protein [Rhodococcus globerulus]